MKGALITLVLALGCLTTFPSRAADSILVVNGKPFGIQPVEVPTCGKAGGPEQAAAIFLVSAAQSFGENAQAAACKAGVQKKCAADDIKRFGVERMFDLIRKYESGLTNDSCRQVRKECEDRCIASKLFDDRHCLIECNQYETWNR